MSNLKHIVSFLFVMFVFVSSCTSSTEQANKTLKDSTMMTTEKFDFEEWKRRLENGKEDYTKEDGTIVRMSGSGNPYISEILPPPSFLYWQRFYYDSGELGRTGFLFQSVQVGTWRTYDKKGNLIKEENFDSQFGKIKPKDILLFLDKEGYINVKTGEGRFVDGYSETFSLGFIPAKESVILGESKSDPIWYITILPYIENDYTQIDYQINGNTGEVIEKKVEKIDIIE